LTPFGDPATNASHGGTAFEFS